MVVALIRIKNSLVFLAVKLVTSKWLRVSLVGFESENHNHSLLYVANYAQTLLTLCSRKNHGLQRKTVGTAL